MKLALLSFHNAANYGASLQAYALQRFLTDKGYDCEYINYVNQSRAHEYSMLWHIYDSLSHGRLGAMIAYTLGLPFMELRKFRFKKFYKAHLHTTNKIYHNSAEASELNGLYDRFIVGSDQVWNPVCNGYDFAFLLDFVKDSRKKISYSPSFGMSSIEEGLKETYRSNLSNFHTLGVRESVGRLIIKNLTGRDATVAIDPVMLLTKDQWLSIAAPKKREEKYIFSYTNRDSQIADFFKTGYKIGGYKHYVLSRYTRPQDFFSKSVRVKYCMSPQTFVSVIANAEMVISASFHCVAMSIILNRPFVAILVGESGKDERLLNLLRLLNLENRILTSEMDEGMIKAPINWEEINNKIENLKSESAKFLLNAIGEEK